MKKRILATVLAAVMALSLLPMSALAAPRYEEEVVAETPMGEEVREGSQKSAAPAQLDIPEEVEEPAEPEETPAELMEGEQGTADNPYMVTLENLQALGTLLANGTADTFYVKAGDNVDLPDGVHIEIPVSATVVLDLAGYSLTAGINAIINKGALTINDSSEDGTGKVYTTNIDAQGRHAVLNYGTIVINGGTFGSSASRGSGFRNCGGTATINGGKFTACDNYTNGGYAYALCNDAGETTINNATVYGNCNGLLAADGGTLTIKGGTFTLGDGSEKNLFRVFYTTSGAINVEGGTFTKNTTTDYGFMNGTINISGGTFEDKQKDIYADGGKVTISGGEFKTKIAEKTKAEVLAVDGGKFANDVSAYVAPTVGYDATTGEVKALTAETGVAEVGGKFYSSLQVAIDAATASGEQVTVKLVKDTEERITVSGGDIVLDLNGKQIANKDTEGEGFFGAITVTGGKLTVDDTSAEKTGKVLGGCFAVVVKNGLLTVNNGSFGYSDESFVGRNKPWNEPLFVGGGSAVINDGFFFGGTLEYYYYYPDASEGSLLVNGGRFDALPLYIAANQGAPIWAPNADGYVVAYKTYGDFAADNAASFTYDSGKNVLQMTGAYNKSATRTDPLSGFFINGDVILDLNGQTWTMENANEIVVNEHVTFTLRDTAGGGMIENKTQAAIETLGTLNIEGGKLSATNWPIISNGNSVINISGGELQGMYGIASAQVTAGREQRTVNVSGGTFNTSGSAFWDLSSTTVSITGGTFKQQPAEQYIATGLETKDNGDGTFSIVIPDDKVAQIVGGGAYATLAEAVAAATAGQTVTLLKDVELTSQVSLNGKTLDLGGNTLSNGSSYYGLVTNGNATVKNGTIELSNAEISGGYCGIYVLNGHTTAEKLTIQSANYTTDEGAWNFGNAGVRVAGSSTFTLNANSTIKMHGYGIVAVDASPTIHVYGTVECSKLDANGYAPAAISGNGNNKTEPGSTINIYKGASVKSLQGVAIYHPQMGTLNINGGLVEGDSAGIAIKSGTLNVKSGATVSCVGKYAAPTEPWGNGAEASGAAIQIEANSGYAGGIEVNVEDGATVESTYGNAIYQYYGWKNDETVDQAKAKLTKITITGGAIIGGSGVKAVDVYDAENADGKIAISGGTFSTDVSAYCADGFRATENNGAWSVAVIPTSDPTPSVTYYTLTIRYVDGEGNEVAPSYTARLSRSSRYNVASPAVEGMVPDQETVSGVMGREDLTVTVTYAANEQLVDPDVPLASGVFIDVAANDWFAAAVSSVYAKELMVGVTANTFAPKALTTRGMVATILHRMESEPTAAAADFSDVLDGAWYAPAVNWANETGLMIGVGNGAFGAEDHITREQLALTFYRYAQFKGQDVTTSGDLSAFADGAETSDWAKEAMTWAVESGLFQGKGQNILDPKADLTRAELAAILDRFFAEEK